MTEEPQPTHVRVATICPMCEAIVVKQVLPYGPNGSVLASPEMQAIGARLTLEHEKTCPGNR
jgi:hypothetical protein